jgi:UDP-2,3-diacylglucosamine pyrophosphatase LpxH
MRRHAATRDWAYTIALTANDLPNRLRRRLGLPYWSLSGYLKQRVKNAAAFISDFEIAVARAARVHGADGVVCGHTCSNQDNRRRGLCNDGTGWRAARR